MDSPVNGWYDEALAQAYDTYIEKALRHAVADAEMAAAITYASSSGEIECHNPIGHEMWFGLMRVEGLDWPCPSCHAQL